MNINNFGPYNYNNYYTSKNNSNSQPSYLNNNVVNSGGANNSQNNADTLGFWKDFSGHFSDIVHEESASVYDRYNASTVNGGARAFFDLCRALYRTLTD